ncbi:hypothetical protein FJZ36_06310 [Candidatus Poribacteria bacterium]|nr:hypothetical protein [Candidatus Poribacteria bacterium]
MLIWTSMMGWMGFAARPSLAAFQDAFAGARYLGMGGASVAVVADTDSMAQNPAGLAELGAETSRRQVGASYAGLHVGLSDDTGIGQNHIAYAMSSPKLGGAGLAWRRTQAGRLYSEDRVGVGVARRVSERPSGRVLSVGVQGDVLFWDAAPTLTSSGAVLEDLSGDPRFSLSAGALFALAPGVSIGLALHHINQPNIVSDRSETDELQPVQTTFGIGARGARFLWTFDIVLELQDVDVRTGLEWLADQQRLALRGGFRLEGLGLGTNLTLGVGYRVAPSTRLDYALWLPIGTVQSTLGSHRVSATYDF